MVSALDDGAGAVIAALEQDGIYENTLVIFLSGNGCAGYIRGACSNAPLSGYERWLAEGGIRIPYIGSWPGHLPAGRTAGRRLRRKPQLDVPAIGPDGRHVMLYDLAMTSPKHTTSPRHTPHGSRTWKPRSQPGTKH